MADVILIKNNMDTNDYLDNIFFNKKMKKNIIIRAKIIPDGLNDINILKTPLNEFLNLIVVMISASNK